MHESSCLDTISNPTTLQRHNTEKLKQIFPEKELCGLSPNFHIHVSVSDLYTPMIGLPILLQESLIQYRGPTGFSYCMQRQIPMHGREKLVSSE